MNTLTGFLDRFLVPVANKMANNKYLSSVSTGFAYALPVITIYFSIIIKPWILPRLYY